MNANLPHFDLRTTIAGVPVRDLSPTNLELLRLVYDAATIVERIKELKPFDAIRKYAHEKANSNLAVLDLVRRQGVLVDAVSAGEIEHGSGCGLPARRRSASDRVHGRSLRPRVARPGCRKGDPAQAGSPR